LLPFKNAPFGLAIAAQVPLVPVYVHNTFEIKPKGRWGVRPRTIQVRVGKPIATAGLTLDDRDQLRDQTRTAIEALRVDAEAVAR
jgi:1-acyl-sn-glycerol-3-phosphate acyltransferase